MPEEDLNRDLGPLRRQQQALNEVIGGYDALEWREPAAGTARGLLAALADLEEQIRALLDPAKGIPKLQEVLRIERRRAADPTAEAAFKAREREWQAELDRSIAKTEEARQALKRLAPQARERDPAVQELIELIRQRKALERRLRRTRYEYPKRIQRLEELRDEVMKELDRCILVRSKEENGKVLCSSSDSRLAWIDLGRRQRVARGTVFEVFYRLKGGKKVPRGTLQVVQVGAERSRALVLTRFLDGRWVGLDDPHKLTDRQRRELREDPLGEDDLIYNWAFDRSFPRQFALAGRLADPGWTAEETARQRIEGPGDRVDGELTWHTSAVVLCQGYENDPIYKQAVELGTPKITERELLELLGRD